MQTLSGAIMRVHSPLSLRTWDLLTTATALAFMGLAVPFLLNDEKAAAAVTLLGGSVILCRCRYDQRAHIAAVWEMAYLSDDPIETLVLHEYLYRVRFSDLTVLARWRAEREAAGLPVIDYAPGAPPQVLALLAHLRGNPRET